MALAGVVLAGPARGQDVVAVRHGSLAASIDAEGSYLETRSRIDGTNGREGVLRLSPGLRWTSRSGAIQGSADYVGDVFLRRGRASTEGSDYQNTLNAQARAEAVPNRVGIEGSASVTQQAVSAFGEQSVSAEVPSGSANRTEVSTVSVAPYLRGSMATAADYELRLGATRSHTRGGDTPDTRGSNGLFTLGSPRGRSQGWNLLLSHRRVESDTEGAQGAAENNRARLTLSGAPVPQLRLSASGGVESIDEGAGAQRRNEKTAGVGLRWSPSQRTELSADIEKRHFGTGGGLSFSRRGPSTVAAYTYSRDTSFGVDGAAAGAPLTLFQLAFAQAASAFPDPAEREQVVLADLLSRGLDPNQVVTVAVLGPTFSLQERQDLSFGWLGRRLSLNLSAFTSSTSSFITVPGADPVANDPVRQRGWSSIITYRLTPHTSLSAGAQRRLTKASAQGPANDLKSADMGLSSQLGRRTTARVDLRYTVFNSPTDPYRTTSVSATISQRY